MAALIVTLLLGLSLYAAPDLVGYGGAARVNHLIVGPIVASLSLIAMADVARGLRWINLLLGAWLVLSAIVIPHEQVALFMGVASGMAITALSIVRGPINQVMGGGWAAVLRAPKDQQDVEGDNDDRAT
jgi:hypothetical protein